MTASTWTAEDLRRPRRWLRAILLVVAIAVLAGVSAGLFLVAGADREPPTEHGPGRFGRVAHIDQLPGYRVDRGAEPPHLGPARLELVDVPGVEGRATVFVPARTPFTAPDRLCPDLQPLPAGASPSGTCLVRVALAEDERTATWVTPHDRAGPGRATVTAEVRQVGGDRLVLADGTVLPVAEETELEGCGGPAEAGERLVVEVDAGSGEVVATACA